MQENKGNGTSSITQKSKCEKIPHPPRKKNISLQSNNLILPLLKDNRDLESINNNKIKYKMKSSKQSGKNRFMIDLANKNILSPIPTELNGNKKRDSLNAENIPKHLFKLKGNSSNQILKIKKNNSKEKNSKNSLLNNFNKNSKSKNLNNIKSDFLPVLNNNKSSSKIKFPIIEPYSYQIKSDKKENNNKKNRLPHKYKSDTLLETNYNFPLKSYATFSRKGTDEDGKNKENNQDISIILNNILQIENYCIYGIMDGHGSNGHLVSKFVKEKVEEYFSDKKIYKRKKLAKTPSTIEVNNLDYIYEKLIYNNYEIIRNFYQKVNDELYNAKFDVHFSGTTCILVFRIGNKIICSNVGDSRAILVKKKKNLENKNINNNNPEIIYDFLELSHDHKPENKEERERIEKLGGEVAQEYLIGKEEPTGPFRVWCKGNDYPGIAISRSLGDKIAELIGVIAEPDIMEFDLDDNCKYIIMGSDGLFDYLSNMEIMNICGPYLINNNPEKACHQIVETAAKLFKEKEDRIDDITINIIIL